MCWCNFPTRLLRTRSPCSSRIPALRRKAAQALLKLGPVTNGHVLQYLNHPDEGVRKEAASLCRLLNIPADRQLEQTLADVADARKGRSRTALQHLARLRPDETKRALVSRAVECAAARS